MSTRCPTCGQEVPSEEDRRALARALEALDRYRAEHPPRRGKGFGRRFLIRRRERVS